MTTVYDSHETWDRLVLLLAARPRDGWEEVFEEITRREVERLAPHPRQEVSPAPGQSERGSQDGTDDKENSASYGRIVPD
jgi:hypothetical protein